LLAAEPTSTTNYAATYTAWRLTKETWTRNPGNLLKEIDYSYTGAKLTQEVRTVYDTDGVTVLAQLTIVYSYSGSTLTSATYTRNV